MLKPLDGLPENVVGDEATGKLTETDYQQVLVPAIRKRREAGEKIRFVYVLGEDFDGWTFGALRDDARIGLEATPDWEKIAIVKQLELTSSGTPKR
jgi:hypothetical protein